MKKLLFSLMSCLLAVCSCNIEGSYYAENVQEFITLTEGQAVTDNGLVFHITSKAASLPEMEEGKRYFLVFDILNQQADIRLRSVTPVTVVEPQPLPETEITAHDPLLFQLSEIRVNGYWNMALLLYKAKESHYDHSISVYYDLSKSQEDTDQLNLYIYHDGNNENPAAMEEKELETENRFLSVDLKKWENARVYTITWDALERDTIDGTYQVNSHTSSTL